MRGFGTPIDTNADPYDWGFGAPSPDEWDASELELGFGEPLDTAFVPVIVSGLPLPDDGGEIVSLAGDWPDLGNPPGQPSGPFRVRLIDGDGVTWPDPARVLGCYSARVTLRNGGKGPYCETDIRRRTLDFSIPPLPPGTYDVEVAWGPHWSTKLLLEAAVSVIYRLRSHQEYGMRVTYPNRYAVGPRVPQMEPLLLAADETTLRAEFPMGPLRVLTRAFAEEIQILGGVPMTLLTAPLAWNAWFAVVETTLGFPPAGAVFIGGRRYTYASKTNTQLRWLVADQNDGTEIPVRADVVLDVTAVLP